MCDNKETNSTLDLNGIKYTIESKPHVCPICDGRGYVSSNFYNVDYVTTAVNTASITCRTCNGRGIVWGG